jgi:hypothetical protein
MSDPIMYASDPLEWGYDLHSCSGLSGLPLMPQKKLRRVGNKTG